jgi:hypothetical protein
MKTGHNINKTYQQVNSPPWTIQPEQLFLLFYKKTNDLVNYLKMNVSIITQRSYLNNLKQLFNKSAFPLASRILPTPSPSVSRKTEEIS